jgi:phosphatidylglycerol:prolipoprotein diacylglycerol transferase
MTRRRGGRAAHHYRNARSRAPGPAPAPSTLSSVPDVESEGLSVTHWFDPGSEGPAYSATIRFTGRRTDVQGVAQAGDSFTQDERIDRVVPGSGPISVTTWVYGINPGEWEVTAELLRTQTAAHRRFARGHGQAGQTLPRAAWSWLRWRVSSAPYASVRTRWAPAARLSRVPAVIHGSWTALVALGILMGLFVQLTLLGHEGVSAGPSILVTVVAVSAGIVGARIWYAVLRPGQWRRSLTEGWSVDGSIVAAPLAGIVMILILGLPLGTFLDASAPAFFFGVAIGRLGCFLTGCCAGHCTASRWGIWSSDRRIGARRVPAQLLESAVGLTLGVVFTLLFAARIPPVGGVLFVVGAATYLLARQVLLRLRADRRTGSLGMEGRMVDPAAR